MSLPQITRCKIGLQPISPYQKKTEPCPNCVRHFEENFKQINNTIQNLQEIIVNQNDVIMKALAEQKVLTDRILYQEVTKKNLPSIFPIRNINGLNELNSSISEDNREAYINTMKSLLKGQNVTFMPSALKIRTYNQKNNCINEHLSSRIFFF